MSHDEVRAATHTDNIDLTFRSVATRKCAPCIWYTYSLYIVARFIFGQVRISQINPESPLAFPHYKTSETPNKKRPMP